MLEELDVLLPSEEIVELRVEEPERDKEEDAERLELLELPGLPSVTVFPCLFLLEEVDVDDGDAAKTYIPAEDEK